MQNKPVVQVVPPTLESETSAERTTSTAGRAVANQAPERAQQPAAAPAPRSAPVAASAEPAATPAASTSTVDTPSADSSIDETAALPATAPLAASDPVVTDTPTQQVPEVATSDQSNQLLVVTLLGGLAALGVIVVGFLAFRRRRPTPASVAAVERPVVEKRPEPQPELVDEPVVDPVAEPRVTVDPSLAPSTPIVATTPRTEVRTVAATKAASRSHAGAAVALPDRMPESFEERDALMRRMVEAKPDRANPFRSPKARARRARLIMQSLDKTFEREPAIDLSQYPNNWPELARRDYASVA